jgi:hypothetical protein
MQETNAGKRHAHVPRARPVRGEPTPSTNRTRHHPRGEFNARQSWVELHNLQLLRCEEDHPHIAYLSLASPLVFLGFPANSGPSPVWGGCEMQTGDIMFHSRGERLHQWTPGPSIWSVIALDLALLEYYGRALSGKPVTPPTEGLVLRPSARDAARLRRLHAQASRLAETRSKMLAHPEVARAIEQELISRAGHLSDFRHGPRKQGWQTPSGQNHGQVRGGAGGEPQPAAADTGLI